MELEAMLFRSLNCTLIGRNTGGYDGSCICFKVRNDFCACYSGDKVLYPDGSQTQRIGIAPDICVERRYQDIVRSTDEILDRAVKYIHDTE